jgi:hypothetical protein
MAHDTLAQTPGPASDRTRPPAPDAASDPGAAPGADPAPETGQWPDGAADREPVRRPGRSAGRLLRRLTGVDEDLLDQVPEERARYTLQGLVVVATAALAGIAVFVALARFTPTPGLLLVPAALFWAGLIMVFDAWLLSTMHGVKEGRQVAVFTGRIVLTVLISLVVAEPLLLYVFRPSIEQEIERTGQEEDAALRSALERCNPESGEQSTDPDCTGEYLLTITGGSLTADQAELAEVEAERNGIRDEVEEIQEELAEKNELARLECNGTSGEGLTGRTGEGPNCRRLRSEADAYERSSGLDEYQARLVELNGQVGELTGQTGTSRAEFLEQRAELIEAEVAERSSVRDEHGVLDEMEALDRLMKDSFYVTAAAVLLRFVLIAVDLFPVLTKLLGRTSKYDELYTDQREFRGELHGQRLRVRRKRAVVETDRRIGELEARRQADRSRIEQSMRAEQVQRRADFESQVDDQAARYRGGKGASQGASQGG